MGNLSSAPSPKLPKLEPQKPPPPPPWLDLADYLTEKILERLPLSDYLRFAAVCRRWCSIQSHHRLRHTPSPPPMASLPWLIPIEPQEKMVSCYSPFEDRSYRVPLNDYCDHCYSFSHGWLLDDSSSCCFSLLNPISGAKIKLPTRPKWMNSNLISVSPPPNYVVSSIGLPWVFLLRWCDQSWTKLELPKKVVNWVNLGDVPSKVISCGRKHYCIFPQGSWFQGPYTPTPCAEHLLVIDGLEKGSTPAVHLFEMMDWKKLLEETGLKYGATHLVESDGELLLVKEVFEDENNCWIKVGFQVFKADLDRKMWVRVERLSERVLVLHSMQCVSLLSVNVGVKGNCIYFSKELSKEFKLCGQSGEAPWKVFDLGSGRVSDAAFPNASQMEKYAQRMFMPNLR